MTKRQHYVPRFYLRAWSTRANRINLLHLPSGRLIEDASLKHQAQKNRFYDNDNRYEKILAELESAAAPILREVIATASLPPAESESYALLLAYVAVQRSRTEQTLDELLNQAETITKAVVESPIAKYAKPESVEEYRNHKLNDPAGLCLSTSKLYFEGITDLTPLLVATRAGETFVTSDHPVVEYNTYCQRTGGRGALGVAALGIQVFLPLSPSLTLILYDSSIYRSHSSSEARTALRITKSDIRQLNDLFIANARTNVYFESLSNTDNLKQQAAALMGLRTFGSITTIDFVEEGDENSTIMMYYTNMPNLRLDLACLNVRHELRSTPPTARSGIRRQDLLDREKVANKWDDEDSDLRDGQPRRFIRR